MRRRAATSRSCIGQSLEAPATYFYGKTFTFHCSIFTGISRFNHIKNFLLTSEMAANLYVTIIGGGLSGLAAARAMRKHHKVTVIERWERGHEVGTVLNMGPVLHGYRSIRRTRYFWKASYYTLEYGCHWCWCRERKVTLLSGETIELDLVVGMLKKKVDMELLIIYRNGWYQIHSASIGC